MPEIVKDLPLTPALSATSDDPNIDAKIALANAPALSVSSDNGPVGEIAPAGDTPEVVKAAEEAKEAAKKQADGEAAPPGDEPVVKEHKEDTTPPWMKAFISKTKNAEAEARREAAEARREAAESRRMLSQVMERVVPQPAPSQVAPEPLPPNESAFDDAAAYHRAYVDYADKRAEWKADRKAEEKMSEYRRAEAEKTARQEAERMESERQAFIDRGRAKYDDWAEKCESDNLSITPFMYEAAKDADGGEDVIYYLGDNPKEARRIAAMKPVQQIREIAKIEAKITEASKTPAKTENALVKEPTPKVPSKAPAPISPVGSSNVVEKTPEQMSTMEYITKRRREEAAKKGITLP